MTKFWVLIFGILLDIWDLEFGNLLGELGQLEIRNFYGNRFR